MSIDNENDAMDTENPGNAGVATAPSLDDLDAAMAALIRAANPSESTQAQSALEPARSGPAMALVNSVSIMDEDDDDDFFDDDEDEEQEAAPAPVVQQRPSTPPAPIPFRAPQAQAAEQQAPVQMQYSQPAQAPQPAPMEYSTPPQPQQQQYSAPQAPAAQEYAAPQQPAPQEYAAPQPVHQPEQAPPAMTAPQPAPQPLPQQAMAPQTVPYQQPVAPMATPAQAQQSTVPQHARATLMHETNQDKHLHDASRYIRTWLEENTNDEEVIEAAMDWARKHKTAEHNGHVLSSLLLLDNGNNEVTVMAVRWLTHHSMHTLAPDIVAALTRRQQQQQ